MQVQTSIKNEWQRIVSEMKLSHVTRQVWRRCKKQFITHGQIAIVTLLGFSDV